MAIPASVPRPAPRPGRRQLAVRRFGFSLFLLGFLAAAYLSVGPLHHGAVRRAASPYSHVYPPDPVPIVHQQIPGTRPMAPKANWIGGGRTLTSFGQLRALLPTDALSRVDGRTWLLRRPVAVTGLAALRVRGPGELRIGVGAFLEALRGGTVDLEDLSIVGVGRDGQPLQHPLQGRGFL